MKSLRWKKHAIAAILLAVVFGGILAFSMTRTSWHEKVGWKAEDFFSDPLVVELCEAIEANNLRKMKSCILKGADVNAIGKDGMTPLLWAFPENKIDRFELLLDHKADASVHVQSDLGTRGFIKPNSTVAHMAAESQFPRHFIAIMKSGCDPNLAYDFRAGDFSYQKTLFHSIFESFYYDKKSRCDAILSAKPSKKTLTTGAWVAVDSTPRGFGIALSLLKAGGDYSVYEPGIGKFINRLAKAERAGLNGFPETRREYLELVEWLESQGEDYEEARNDLQRWVEAGRIDINRGAALRESDIAEKIEREKSTQREP
jgi:uncharacterized protein